MCFLLDEPVDGPVEGFHSLHIIFLDGIDDAVADMIFHNNFTGIVDRVADCCQLNQYITAVLIAFHHPPDGFKVADRPRQAVDHRSFFCRTVYMMMLHAVRMVMGVLVRMTVRMVMQVLVRMTVRMVMRVFVRMIVSMFLYFQIYYLISRRLRLLFEKAGLLLSVKKPDGFQFPNYCNYYTLSFSSQQQRYFVNRSGTNDPGR